LRRGLPVQITLGALAESQKDPTRDNRGLRNAWDTRASIGYQY